MSRRLPGTGSKAKAVGRAAERNSMCKFHEVGRNKVARLLGDFTLGRQRSGRLCLRSFLCKKNRVMVVCVYGGSGGRQQGAREKGEKAGEV